jgi:hypothetical protein
MEKLLKSLLLISLMVLTSLKAPELHKTWLRHKLSGEVVMITNKTLNSGGSGVHVKLPSGEVAILTNGHVCAIKDSENMLWVSQEGNDAIPRRVIQISDYTDLCLVQPLPGHNGLRVGYGPYLGEHLYTMGHPHLLPNTLLEGDILGQSNIGIIDHFSQDDCDLPKNKKGDVSLGLFGSIPVCYLYIPAYSSTITSLPGSSGSPAVDASGRLQGLIFAGDTAANWGFLVTNEDIRTFLRNY